MKKIILLLGIVTMSFSCSSDDSKEEGGNLEQKLNGKWKNISQKLDGVNRDLSECDLKDTYAFSSPLKQFFAEIHSENDQQNNCDQELFIGTYTIANNKVTINAEGQVVILQDINFSGEVMTTTEMDGPTKIVTTWVKIN